MPNVIKKVQGVVFIFFLVIGTLGLMSCGSSSGGGSLDDISRVSVHTDGTEADGQSYEPGISGNGRYVALESGAATLVDGDTNGVNDIFLRDELLGTTIRVSVSTAGAQATGGDSGYPSISDDGRYVGYSSRATNLVVGDTNSFTDVFVRDTTLNTTIRVSVNTAGTEANSFSSGAPGISTDGRYVAFSSGATNLVGSDTNGVYDIFVRDTVDDTTTRVSVHTSGAQVTGGSSQNPSISGDGRYVVFDSSATDLVAGDTNGNKDVFVRDTTLNTTSRISVDSAGAQVAGGASSDPAISLDGRYVVFQSGAINLVAGDTNGVNDIFLRDTTLNTTTRVSVDTAGAQVNGGSSLTTISSDGRYVAFESGATDLVAGDTNASDDIFVRDTVNNTTIRVSVDASGVEGDSGSAYSAISSNGNYVTFESDATNLVAGDTNVEGDVFRAPNQ